MEDGGAQKRCHRGKTKWRNAEEEADRSVGGMWIAEWETLGLFLDREDVSRCRANMPLYVKGHKESWQSREGGVRGARGTKVLKGDSPQRQSGGLKLNHDSCAAPPAGGKTPKYHYNNTADQYVLSQLHAVKVLQYCWKHQCGSSMWLLLQMKTLWKTVNTVSWFSPVVPNIGVGTLERVTR